MCNGLKQLLTRKRGGLKYRRTHLGCYARCMAGWGVVRPVSIAVVNANTIGVDAQFLGHDHGQDGDLSGTDLNDTRLQFDGAVTAQNDVCLGVERRKSPSRKAISSYSDASSLAALYCARHASHRDAPNL